MDFEKCSNQADFWPPNRVDSKLSNGVFRFGTRLLEKKLAPNYGRGPKLDDPSKFEKCKFQSCSNQADFWPPNRAAKIYNALPKVKRSEPFTNKEFC